MNAAEYGKVALALSMMKLCFNDKLAMLLTEMPEAQRQGLIRFNASLTFCVSVMNATTKANGSGFVAHTPARSVVRGRWNSSCAAGIACCKRVCGARETVFVRATAALCR